ncbi:hypothetical protein D3C75_1115210 [compost metagenome]
MEQAADAAGGRPLWHLLGPAGPVRLYCNGFRADLRLVGQGRSMDQRRRSAETAGEFPGAPGGKLDGQGISQELSAALRNLVSLGAVGQRTDRRYDHHRIRVQAACR